MTTAQHIHEFEAESALAALFRSRLSDNVKVSRGSELGDETELPLCSVVIRSATDAVPNTGTMEIELVVSVLTALDESLNEHVKLCGEVFDVLYSSDFLSALNSQSEIMLFQRAEIKERHFEIAVDVGLRASWQVLTLRTAMKT